MPEAFDAYHKWLGIPPHERPPHHYRLLAIDLFEADLDVIASAADQRMAHVRTFQAGPHADESQKILNEIAAARICLLNPEKKADYDRKLRLLLETQRAAGVPPTGSPRAVSPPAARAELPQPAFQETAAGHLARRRRPIWLPLVAVAAAACVVVVVLSLPGDQPPEVVHVDPAPTVVPPNVPDSPDTVPDSPDTAPDSRDTPVSLDVKPPEPPPEANPPTTVEPPATADTPPPLATPPVVASTPPSASQRAAVPDAAVLAAAKSALSAVVATGDPRQLISQAIGPEQPPAECYYLLSQAKKLAIESGDAAAAFDAEKELLSRFEIDPIRTKAETLKALAQSATTAGAARQIATNSLAVADEAAAAGDSELASELAVVALKFARQADDGDLERQATIKILDLGPPKAPSGAPAPAS